MITVIGEKYRCMDTSFGKIDLNAFFLRLQEQDDGVATWKFQIVKKNQVRLSSGIGGERISRTHQSNTAQSCFAPSCFGRGDSSQQ